MYTLRCHLFSCQKCHEYLMFISKKVQISSEFNKYSIKFRTVTVYVQLVQLRLSKMKLAISIAALLLAISSFAFAQSDLERAKQEFTTLRDELTVNRFSDILFLLDTSDSLDSFGFDSEKKFIIKLFEYYTCRHASSQSRGHTFR